MYDHKEGSLVPVWRRIIEPEKIGAYLRICASLGINVEERARMYVPPLAEPKVRLITALVDTPENVAHLKCAIAAAVDKRNISLWAHIAPSDLAPAPAYKPAVFHRRRDDEVDWDMLNGLDDDYSAFYDAEERPPTPRWTNPWQPKVASGADGWRPKATSGADGWRSTKNALAPATIIDGYITTAGVNAQRRAAPRGILRLRHREDE